MGDEVDGLKVRGTLRRKLGAILALLPALAVAAPVAAAAAHAPSSDVIVQFDPGVDGAHQRAVVRAAGGTVLRNLHVIRALGARVPGDARRRLAGTSGVRAVTPNAAMRPAGAPGGGRWAAWDPAALATAFVQSTRTDKVWTDPKSPATGAPVAVAVIDTGIDGDLPDFRVAQKDPSPRVIASVVTNPDAATASDTYGHGTHVAGLIAGNGAALAPSDPLVNRYLGTAPQARLVSIKVSDDRGNATVADVVAGLQFVVDHGEDYGIRVANLSLGSTVALSAGVDPLDAAVDAAWASGVVVVAAAGNRGDDADAVSYAPANNPSAIAVGAVDDRGTKHTGDDTLASWSSRGLTQDGFVKPDLVAPGMHLIAPLAPGSAFVSLCSLCVVDGRYFRASGTSMAAPVVAGIAADLIGAHPKWSADQVKGALTSNLRRTTDGRWEVAADWAIGASAAELTANQDVPLSPLLDPATGWLDPTRASWGRASWRFAVEGLRASWGAASWTCDCAAAGAGAGAEARTSRASWRTFFGDAPAAYGELSGDHRGAARRPSDR